MRNNDNLNISGGYFLGTYIYDVPILEIIVGTLMVFCIYTFVDLIWEWYSDRS